LFITFIVILTTLLLQGLTLPYVIKMIGFPKFDDHLPEEEAHKKIKKELFSHSTNLIQEKYGEKLKEKKELYQLLQNWQDNNDDLPLNFTPEKKILYLELLHKQRELLISLNNDEHKMDEEIIRKYLKKIDLEEEKIKL
jgi:CPA1 family monovalent cation:H+ antiporter